jgi:putative ABC transport system ATP-binding protein
LVVIPWCEVDAAELSMTQPVLEARDLVVDRGETRVLDGVDLAVNPEDRILIRGDSGAGKTTLFHVLALLDVPTGGQILVRGEDTTALTEGERATVRRDTVGVVFQEFNLIPDLTARENAALPQHHAGNEVPAWIDGLLETLSIHDRANAYPASLSGGEKQRVAIARALANRPDVVLADEPTGQLDPEAGEEVVDLLVELQDETDAAIVVVSHDEGLGDRFDRHLHLDGGKLYPG